MKLSPKAITLQAQAISSTGEVVSSMEAAVIVCNLPNGFLFCPTRGGATFVPGFHVEDDAEVVPCTKPSDKPSDNPSAEVCKYSFYERRLYTNWVKCSGCNHTREQEEGPYAYQPYRHCPAKV